LTYDYRGTGDSRQQGLTGYNQPKSLVGFKASMSEWAAQDIAAAVAWMRERYKALPFGFFRAEHSDTLWRGAAEWIEAGEQVRIVVAYS